VSASLAGAAEPGCPTLLTVRGSAVLRDRMREFYRRSPEPLKKQYRRARRTYGSMAKRGPAAREAWVHDVYTEFAQRTRSDVMLSIARFHSINRPMLGYYLEFGSHEANTMRLAWDAFHHLFEHQFVAFDSFEGLPEIAPTDEQEIWAKGRLKTGEEDFREICRRHGIPDDRLMTVKGFYDDTLNDETRERLAPTKAAVIYVDCDLYTSTVPVLRFAKHFLQRGTVIVFDDWFCFHGDPDKGERRAWREFLEQEPQLRFEPFVSNQELQSFIYLGDE
jgi:O-methyltransferase